MLASFASSLATQGRCMRDAPWPMLMNVPPTYTKPPPTASVTTSPSGLGSQGETELSDRMWARPARGTPPTEVKDPPMNQPPAPSEATVTTFPATRGKFGVAWAGVVSDRGTPEPYAVPTLVKAPPM